MKAYSLLAESDIYENLLSSSPRRSIVLALKRAMAVMKGDEAPSPLHGFMEPGAPYVYLTIKPVCENNDYFKMLISYNGFWAQKSEEPYEMALPVPLA